MVLLKELTNRAYKGKECVAFDYQVKGDKDEVLVEAHFVKHAPAEWWMRIIFARTRDADSQVYNFGYKLPKEGMDLVMICAIGLKYFQLYLKEEIQKKSMIDFAIGDLVNGMNG